MPIISNSGGNRVINPNARAADVARATLDAVIPIQQRKQDAAFLVNGYTGVLYSYLTSGMKCACQSKRKATATSPALQSFMDDFREQTERNPFAPRMRVWRDVVGFEVSIFGGMVDLGLIVSLSEKGAGNASSSITTWRTSTK